MNQNQYAAGMLFVSHNLAEREGQIIEIRGFDAKNYVKYTVVSTIPQEDDAAANKIGYASAFGQQSRFAASLEPYQEEPEVLFETELPPPQAFYDLFRT